MKRKILWAPWRIKYIQGLAKKNNGCFLCHDVKTPEEDAENFVLWRTEHCLVVFNRFPYNNGHLLVAPKRHVPSLSELTEAEMLETFKLVSKCQQALEKTISPHGFNVGINIGRCAGAGLPDHIHVHIVPRWDGDTNFMHVCSDTDVISQGMTELYEQLKQISRDNNLPGL